MSEEKQGLRRNFGIQKWIETYCTTFWVNEPPFTSHFGVHQRTWFLTQNHIATTATASLWSLRLDPILVVAKKHIHRKTFCGSSLDFCSHRSMALTTLFKEYAQHHETKCVTFPQPMQNMQTKQIRTGWLSEACLKSSAAPFCLLAYRSRYGCWSKIRYLGKLQSPISRESTTTPMVSIATYHSI